jgi:hypothetical protein
VHAVLGHLHGSTLGRQEVMHSGLGKVHGVRVAHDRHVGVGGGYVGVHVVDGWTG